MRTPCLRWALLAMPRDVIRCRHAAPNHTIYDHANPEMRQLWVDNVVKVVTDNKGLVDGVFCDRAGGIGDVSSKDLGCYDFAEGQLHEWDAGYVRVSARTFLITSPSFAPLRCCCRSGPLSRWLFVSSHLFIYALLF